MKMNISQFCIHKLMIPYGKLIILSDALNKQISAEKLSALNQLFTQRKRPITKSNGSFS